MRNRVLLLSLAAGACVAPDRMTRVPVGSQLLVASGSEPTLRTFNPQTGNRIRTFGTAGSASGITVSNNGHKAVVSSGNQLTVVDLRQELHDRVIEVDDIVRGMAFLDPRSRMLVPVASGDLHVVSVQSGKVERTIPTDIADPRGLTISHQLQRAYIADAASAEVVAVDIEKGRTIGRVPVAADPVRVRRRYGTEEVWVASASGSLTVFSKKLEVSATLEAGNPIALSFAGDGELAVVADGRGGAVHVFDAERRERLASISLADGLPAGVDPTPVDVLVEPHGRYAYVPLAAASLVVVIDLETNEIRGTFQSGDSPVGVAWTFLRRHDMLASDGC